MLRTIFLILIFIVWLATYSLGSTYYVHPSGDNSDGLSWSKAWTTLDSVNANVVQSDTVYFGTGLWRGGLKLMQGTFSNRTVYACSAFADTNQAGDYHFAKIYASTNYKDSTWTQIGETNVYYTSYGITDGHLVCQADSFLWLQADSADVDAAGEFWISADSSNLYVYVYDLGSGYDPEGNYDMECANTPVINKTSWFEMGDAQTDSCDYVTVWGLQLKYGSQSLVAPGSGRVCSLFVDHCKLSHVTGASRVSMDNPACWNSSVYPSDPGRHNRVRACSIGYVIQHAGFASSHGNGIVTYSQSNFTVDSCTFFGYFTGVCAMLKNDGGGIDSNLTVAYNVFDPILADFSFYLYRHLQNVWIYGNIFKGNYLDDRMGGIRANPSTDPVGHNWNIFNNTFIGCTGMSSKSACAGDDSPVENRYFKYNIVYITDALDNSRPVMGVAGCETLSTYSVIDSNLYCVNDSVIYVGPVWCNDVGYSGWTEQYGFDTHSDFVPHLDSIYFNDYAGGDYSRPTVSDEMNRTYGGKTWTIYGAWQPNDPLPPPPDTTSPGRIEDLNAIPGNNHGEIILTWTAPGDDGFTGLADHYVIKYSPTAITESNWADFPAVLNPPQPLSPGDSTYFALDTHEDGHYYYIAIKTYDEVGIASDLSNVAFSFSGGIMVPTQISTETDSVNNSVQLTCTTVESYKSINYLFALDSVSAYSNPEFVIDSLANLPSDVAMAVFEGLSDDVNYYWRCCAISTDYTDSSAWTPTLEFNLHFGLISSLAASDCLRPTEGESVPSSRPYFIVRNPQDIYELYFQVDDNDNFSSPVESGSVPPTPGDETRWQLPATDPIEQGITYYWRVSNNNAVWTSPISFSALLEIHPYPNPFRASEGHTNITFTNLPQDSSIMISTISGDIILREDNIGPGDWVWDVKNDGGNNLAPGVYLYAINLPSGSSNGKLLIIR